MPYSPEQMSEWVVRLAATAAHYKVELAKAQELIRQLRQQLKTAGNPKCDVCGGPMDTAEARSIAGRNYCTRTCFTDDLMH